MQARITVGSILQNRYRIIQTLSEGEFSSSYLAEDQGRFNELCTIKELISVTGADGWDKAQEVFQQEAAILYQIDHPQVPEFRERFQEEQRLFLVEDYIAGKSYRTLLSQRLEGGETFTEAEILQLIRSVLPVLDHIHGQGIIHRQISPDNIILPDGDRLPVLINFAIIQELTTRLQSPDSTTPVTSPDNLGFAPSEQIESGLAYPHSDLYALAVTAIVLLTGKEPSDLFDQSQLTWNWQKWVQVNPEFAQVINQMLNHLPGDRFSNAADVIQALEKLEKPSIPTPEVSQLQTIAISHPPEPVATPVSSPKPQPVISRSQSHSILDNPFALGAISAGVIILASVGSWLLVSLIRTQPMESPQVIPPQSFPSPIVTGEETLTPEPTLEPTPEPTPENLEPVIVRNRLNLRPSEIRTVEDTIQVNQIIQYRFSGEAGDKLTVLMEPGSGILLTVLDENQESIEIDNSVVTVYTGILPNTGIYMIQLTPEPQISASDYSLNLVLENPDVPTSTEEIPGEETPVEETPVEETPFFNPTPSPILKPDFGRENDPPSQEIPELQ